MKNEKLRDDLHDALAGVGSDLILEAADENNKTVIKRKAPRFFAAAAVIAAVIAAAVIIPIAVLMNKSPEPVEPGALTVMKTTETLPTETLSGSDQTKGETETLTAPTETPTTPEPAFLETKPTTTFLEFYYQRGNGLDFACRNPLAIVKVTGIKDKKYNKFRSGSSYRSFTKVQCEVLYAQGYVLGRLIDDPEHEGYNPLADVFEHEDYCIYMEDSFLETVEIGDIYLCDFRIVYKSSPKKPTFLLLSLGSEKDYNNCLKFVDGRLVFDGNYKGHLSVINTWIEIFNSEFDTYRVLDEKRFEILPKEIMHNGNTLEEVIDLLSWVSDFNAAHPDIEWYAKNSEFDQALTAELNRRTEQLLQDLQAQQDQQDSVTTKE